MQYIEKPINIKEIPKDYPVDMCLVENNEKQIEQICNFLQNDNKLLMVNGFRGSGKSDIVKFTLNYSLDYNTIVLGYFCIETTILDDMLLSFFDTFKTYTIMGQITPPKIKVENFTQKINSYFNSIEKPILIVLDSFDTILKENKPDIINFIKHLLKYPNIKLILISKALILDDFQDIEFEQTTMLAFTPKLFEKYLKLHGIKQIGVLSNELYNQSKGYYNLLKLSVNIMNTRGISLVEFLEMFSKSFVPFKEFVLREALTLIDPISAHLFRLLTIMRIPIHINLLKSLHLYDDGRVYFFIENSILSNEGEYLYLKDYFREILENQIPNNVIIKLHSACVDLYNTQLPLKPLERDLKLSRQTMRNEIEYHSMFIPKKPILHQTKDIQVPIETNANTILENKPAEPAKPQVEETPQETKEEKINKISFIIEDEVVLDNIADSIKDFVITSVEDSKLEKESNSMNLKQILNNAKQEEAEYNYKRAIMLYQNALTKTNDDDFYTFLPSIYIKLAKNYQNLSDLYNALEYYTQAQDFYYNASNMDKVYEIKLEIANLYYNMYKHDNAKFILSELEKNNNLQDKLKIKVNMACAKIEDNIDIKYNYYKKALSYIDTQTNKSTLAELYYKYGAVCDEIEDIRTAVTYYRKCIEIEPNPKNNEFLSMALSNLAQLYDEAGQSKAAIKYYLESIKIDTAMNNFSGIYSSSLHLAEIYAPIDEQKAVEYMKNALNCAQKINEPFYIAGASLELGDFYFLRRDNENAYKHFIEAYNIAKNSFSKENLAKITSRINDIKSKIRPEIFEKLQEKYGK